MKQRVLCLFLLFALLLPVYTGCTHQHSFGGEWTAEEDYHWRGATCEHTEEREEEPHAWHQYKIELPTCTEEGTQYLRCNVCGYERNYTLPITHNNNGSGICADCGAAIPNSGGGGSQLPGGGSGNEGGGNGGDTGVPGGDGGGTPTTSKPLYVRKPDGTIEFGSYPQTEVTDSLLLWDLNTYCGTLPTENTLWGEKWYQGNANPHLWKPCTELSTPMWYLDITHLGERYRAIYCKSYRRTVVIGDSSGINYQYQNGYRTETVYWFKYEPLSWSVYQQGDGQARLICNTVIDALPFQNDYYRSSSNINVLLTQANGAPYNTHANLYEYSFIRKWLNDTFYDVAFTEAEQALIADTTGSYHTVGAYGDATLIGEITDRVTLMSYLEMTDTEKYQGFTAVDPLRERPASQYALAQGVICYINEDSPYHKNAAYMLRDRDAGSYRMYNRSVAPAGSANNNQIIYNETNGVLPSLTLILALD